MSAFKTVIIDINRINENDSFDDFILHTLFDVVIGIDNYNGLPNEAFLITDNIAAKNKAIQKGIGLSVYTTTENDPMRFPEALYCIDTIKDMSDETINRMYQRAAGIPWTILETDRCVVREITVEDVDRLYEIYSIKEVHMYIENLFENKDDEIQYTKDYISNQYRFFEYGLWGVVLKESGELIGRAGIFDRENQDIRELGFVFDRKVWGTGIAEEVLRDIINYAKEELLIDKICANVLTENVRSEKLLKKLKFKYDKEVMIDNKKYNQLLLSL